VLGIRFESQRQIRSALRALFMVAWTFSLIISAHNSHSEELNCESAKSQLRVLSSEFPHVKKQIVAPDTLHNLSNSLASRGVAKHPLLVVFPKLIAKIEADQRTIKIGEHEYCAAPQLVNLHFGIIGYIAYIDNRVASDSCVEHELLQHAEKHLRTDERAVSEFLQSLKVPLVSFLSTLKKARHETANGAIEAFDRKVAAFMNQAVENSKSKYRSCIG
jgi:hypothetical protein